MAECEHCKDFNQEKENIKVTDINVGGTFYNYDCPIIYCPNCGKLLNKYKGKVKTK